MSKNTIAVITMSQCGPCNMFKQHFMEDLLKSFEKRKDIRVYKHNIDIPDEIINMTDAAAAFKARNGFIADDLASINPALPNFITFFPNISIYRSADITKEKSLRGVVYNSKIVEGRPMPSDTPSPNSAVAVNEWIDKILAAHPIFTGVSPPPSSIRSTTPSPTLAPSSVQSPAQSSAQSSRETLALPSSQPSSQLSQFPALPSSSSSAYADNYPGSNQKNGNFKPIYGSFIAVGESTMSEFDGQPRWFRTV